MEKIERTDAEWREVLTPEQYAILREAGTERAGTGSLLHNHDTGVYTCGACNNPLFASDTKFESGSGWPSFYKPITPESIDEIEDTSHGMRRVEVRCGKCSSHLGHVFPDPPQPTGEGFCLNSAALNFSNAAG